MILENLHYKTEWKIRKYANDEDFADDLPFEVSEFEGNVLLNEGINEMLLLLTGGAGTAYSNANAYLGVGDSAPASSPLPIRPTRRWRRLTRWFRRKP
jgi:hypothetical protein